MSSFYSFRNMTNMEVHLGVFQVGRTRAYQTYSVQHIQPGGGMIFRENYHLSFTVLDPMEEDDERKVLASVKMDPKLEVDIGNRRFEITVHVGGEIRFQEVGPIVV